MLLKLLKYDFRAMWKQFSLIWGAALALALVNRFVLFRDTDNAILSEDGLFMLAFVAVIVAMFVIAVMGGLRGGSVHLPCPHASPEPARPASVSLLVGYLPRHYEAP